MRAILRLLIAGGLGGLAYLLFRHYQTLSTIHEGDPGYDPTRVMVIFLLLIGLGVAAGVFFAFAVLPAIGEQVGQFFYSPGQKMEKNPHAPALACIARGDYEGAVAAYRTIVAEHPQDTHAIGETARLLCERLEKPGEAAAFLEERLQQEWGAEDLAFLANRLVDVHWIHNHDAASARPILEQIVESMPETRHSANAAHRLREMDKELALQPAPPDPAAGEIPGEAVVEDELEIEFLLGPDARTPPPPKT